MRYTSDSLVAQRNFPSLYKYNKSFFFSRGCSKRRTRRESIHHKTQSLPLPSSSLSSSRLCVSLWTKRLRRLKRREFTHQIILLTRKHPKRAAERGFDAKKMTAPTRFVFLPFFFSRLCFFCCRCVLLFRGEREIFCTTEMIEPRQKIVIIVIRFLLSVVIVARVENAHSS